LLRTVIGLLALVAIAAIVLATRAGRSDAAFPVGANGTAAWESDSDGDLDILVANTDGSDPVNLTNELLEGTPSAERDPSFSPDGKLIVFSSNSHPASNTGDDIWLMNADGTNKRNLTPFANSQLNPVFTPDGKRIVFESNSGGTTAGDIYVMNLDGSGLTNLTPAAESEDQAPVVSPDGSKIAFERNLAPGNDDIYVMRIDGSDLTNLTPEVGGPDQEKPAWSPDGKRIAMEVDPFGMPNDDIVTIDAATGGSPNQVSSGESIDQSPVYTGDGTQVLFQRADPPTGDADIFAISVDGSGFGNLTPSFAGDDLDPATETIYGCGGLRATIVGSDRKEILSGTKRPDVIVGNGGNDKIRGKGGKDRVCGGAGKDKIFGGAGRDRLFGQAGRDALVGGGGKDRLRGGTGKDSERQ
jgi:dipeptidyl aminopeptidase/acylaminoacyl peptidase